MTSPDWNFFALIGAVSAFLLLVGFFIGRAFTFLHHQTTIARENSTDIKDMATKSFTMLESELKRRDKSEEKESRNENNEKPEDSPVIGKESLLPYILPNQQFRHFVDTFRGTKTTFFTHGCYTSLKLTDHTFLHIICCRLSTQRAVKRKIRAFTENSRQNFSKLFT